LFHSYFRIPNIDNIKVVGLGGLKVADKVSKSNYASVESSDIAIAGEVDRVYSGLDSNKVVTISSEGKPAFTVEDRKNLGDVVVWNPWIEKANGLGDFYPKEGYKNMICVETGSVADWVSVSPGNKWEASQTLKAHL